MPGLSSCNAYAVVGQVDLADRCGYDQGLCQGLEQHKDHDEEDGHGGLLNVPKSWMTILLLKPMVTWGNAILRSPHISEDCGTIANEVH